ncbi:MAG: YdcF family protein [Elainella sp.]
MNIPFAQPFWKIGLVALLLLALLFAGSAVRLTLASIQAPQPQAILMLGGGTDRERFTAQFAQAHPDLEVWVSSGIAPAQALPIFQAAQIPTERLHLDYRASDTVTNFTTLVPSFKQQHIRHIYLITSDFHMPRAQAIAFLVLGSQGIAFTPVAIPSDAPPESPLRVLRDIGRSCLWITTGHTGASLRSQFG